MGTKNFLYHFISLMLISIRYFRLEVPKWVKFGLNMAFITCHGKRSPKLFIEVAFRYSWLGIRVDISQNEHVRIWWNISHFEPFNILILMHQICWFAPLGRLCVTTYISSFGNKGVYTDFTCPSVATSWWNIENITKSLNTMETPIKYYTFLV